MTSPSPAYRAPIAGRNRILIPAGVPRIPGGIWLSAACRPAGLAAAWALGASTRYSVRLTSLPASSPPLPAIDWYAWARVWLPDVASPPARWVIGLPADRRRRRFHLLIPDQTGTPLAFAKFTTNPMSEQAVRARMLLDSRPPATFWTPRLLGQAQVGGWWFTIDEAMPNGFHRPAQLCPDVRRNMTEEIQDLLAGLATTPPGQTVIHGDFGPWNVRRTHDGTVVVLDWEEVSVGPRGADELWHELNSVLIARRYRRSPADSVRRALGDREPDEITTAASFWLVRLSRPEASEIESAEAPGRPQGRLLRLQRHTLEVLSQG
jgi:hypothetical protein